MAHNLTNPFDSFSSSGEHEHMLEELPGSGAGSAGHSRSGSTPTIIEPGRSLSRSSLTRASLSRPYKRQTYQRLSSSHSSPFASFSSDTHQGTQEADEPPDYGLGISESGREGRASFEAGHDYIEAGMPRDRAGTAGSTPYSFTSSTRLLGDSPPDQLTPEIQTRFSTSSRSQFNDFTGHCPSKENIRKPASHYVFVTLLILSIFSTVFSVLFLIIASWRPQYDRFILSEGGNLTPSNAMLLFNLFAKLIEMSFLSVFIAWLGQTVSTRAFRKEKGVTLAQLSIRTWVLQPATMLTHWPSVRSVLFSVMGVFAFLAALSSMLYTTAAATLVTPHLSPGKVKDFTLAGEVNSIFANTTYITSQCKTPITAGNYGTSNAFATCAGISLSAQSQTDYTNWAAQWTAWKNGGGNSTDLKARPPGSGFMNGNISVTGTWIDVRDMEADSQKAGRWVNNVTLAFPHAGVVEAAALPQNDVLRPSNQKEDLDGAGAFEVKASVSSPVVNVVCVNMSEQEMAPMIWQRWPAGHSASEKDWKNWTYIANDSKKVPSWPGGKDQWLNKTVVDDLFHFGERYGEKRRPPVFPKYPIPFNTILNGTGTYTGRDYLWLLGTPPPAPPGAPPAGYVLCGIRGYRTPRCSTTYKSTNYGSQLNSTCEDPRDRLQYLKTKPDAPDDNSTVSLDYVDLAQQWAVSTPLNTGLTDGNASIQSTLMHFLPTTYALPAGNPSIAEALAVMAGGTLLRATSGAPFDMSLGIDAQRPARQDLRATLQVQQYASGTQKGWQNVLFVVLVLVAAGNILVLVSMLRQRSLITDFCDPANLFGLSINSPPSHVFAGACGGGPSNAQYRARWFLGLENDHVYLENDEQEAALALQRTTVSRNSSMSKPLAPSPNVQTFSRLAKRRSFF